MNGVHDMGGMMNFGPVEEEAVEPAFHAEWERRGAHCWCSLPHRYRPSPRSRAGRRLRGRRRNRPWCIGLVHNGFVCEGTDTQGGSQRGPVGEGHGL